MSKIIARWFNYKRAYWLIALLNGFAWCWLFLIDDAKLSNNAFTGYLTITIAFLLVVFISTTCFWYAIKYLNDQVKKFKNPIVILKIFFVWAAVELLVSWLLAIIWIGRGGSWTTLVPFSSLTPWLMWTPLRYIARFVGFYGVSASVVTVLFMLAHKKLLKYAPIYVALIAVLTFGAWKLYDTHSGLQTKATIVAEYVGQPKDLHIKNYNLLVVLPEYGLDNINTRDQLDKRIQNYGGFTFFVGSQQVPGLHGFTNTLVFGNEFNGITNRQQKSRLIPGGEYLPFPVEVLLRMFAKDTYTNFEVTRGVVKGSDKLKPFILDDNITVGSAACSSVIATEDYRSLVKQGATLLTNSASLDIFRGSRLFNWQHRGLAKFMAVANARPMLQSSNNWPAFALDKNGNQLVQIQPVGSVSVTVVNNKAKTLYTILGEWPAYIGGLWLAADLALWKYKKRHKSSKKLSTG